MRAVRLNTSSGIWRAKTAGRDGARVLRRRRRHIGHTLGMQDAFGYVLFGVVGVAIVFALLSLLVRAKAYEDIGKGGFFREGEDGRPKPPAAGYENDPFRDEEIRQMLTARNARHTASGEGEIVDGEAELARLTAPVIDPELEAEIRDFVIRRNERRVAKGQAPLDVEAEVARRIAEAGG
jgi:hypothetical protein